MYGVRTAYTGFASSSAYTILVTGLLTVYPRAPVQSQHILWYLQCDVDGSRLRQRCAAFLFWVFDQALSATFQSVPNSANISSLCEDRKLPFGARNEKQGSAIVKPAAQPVSKILCHKGCGSILWRGNAHAFFPRTARQQYAADETVSVRSQPQRLLQI